MMETNKLGTVYLKLLCFVNCLCVHNTKKLIFALCILHIGCSRNAASVHCHKGEPYTQECRVSISYRFTCVSAHGEILPPI